MNEKIIARANAKIDVNDFLKLTKLYKDYVWLEYEPQALFELWSLSDNNEQKSLLESLINNFSFIDSNKLRAAGYLIANHIEKVWNFNSSNTYLSATCDDSKPDGSQSLIQSLKNKFSITWKENNFFNSLPVAANNIGDNNNLILVDDFIGTGDTIIRKLQYLKNTLIERDINGTTIKIVSLATMNFAKDSLNNLGIDYYSTLWLKKGISELVNEEIRDVAINSMTQLEDKLKKNSNGRRMPNFGYKRSEALFALEAYNVPNNVFPVFWWPYLKDGILRRTIFNRI
ncbi:MAG TPA: hypothetical protein VFG10_15880 [Saprospiraceae bacterium]|nr:hypothetical protein [Saprospiraceae bacterium]